MKSRYLGILAALTLAFLLSGCMFARQKINIENFHAKAETIVPGKTKAKELTEILGSQPNAIIDTPEGKKIFAYTFGEAKTKGLTLILFNVRKTNLGIDTAYFFIDKNNVVEEKIISTNSKEIPWEWWAFGD
ncbi:MAG: hypothetical protein ACYTG7_12115 [Planctomycetota bacterium]|jgi:hypothetical protein